MTTTHRGFRALVLAGALATFALITLGGVVRVTGSGLGCPDWPLCHGKLLPPLEYHVLIEYSHRLTASLVSLLVLSIVAVAWWRYRDQGWVFLPALLALAALGVEVVLGGITVLAELPPTIVAAHLGTAQVLFGLLIVMLVLVRPPPRALPAAEGRFFHWALGAALGTLLVTLSGSYVVGAGASPACPDWPLCQGGLLPSGSLAWLHMAHRLLAAGVTIVVIRAALLGWRLQRDSPAFLSVGLLILCLLVAQTVVGAANSWLRWAPLVRVLHLSLATALWGSLVALAALARSARGGER